jgi:trehalose/maltose hydrolase-like predicted phosphorylase
VALEDVRVVVFEGWDPADEGRREELCTVGNGRFATRGTAVESAADGVHYPSTHAASCYNRLRAEVGGQVVEPGGGKRKHGSASRRAEPAGALR